MPQPICHAPTWQIAIDSHVVHCVVSPCAPLRCMKQTPLRSTPRRAVGVDEQRIPAKLHDATAPRACPGATGGFLWGRRGVRGRRPGGVSGAAGPSRPQRRHGGERKRKCVLRLFLVFIYLHGCYCACEVLVLNIHMITWFSLLYGQPNGLVYLLTESLSSDLLIASWWLKILDPFSNI